MGLAYGRHNRSVLRRQAGLFHSTEAGWSSLVIRWQTIGFLIYTDRLHGIFPCLTALASSTELSKYILVPDR